MAQSGLQSAQQAFVSELQHIIEQLVAREINIGDEDSVSDQLAPAVYGADTSRFSDVIADITGKVRLTVIIEPSSIGSGTA